MIVDWFFILWPTQCSISRERVERSCARLRLSSDRSRSPLFAVRSRWTLNASPFTLPPERIRRTLTVLDDASAANSNTAKAECRCIRTKSRPQTNTRTHTWVARVHVFPLSDVCEKLNIQREKLQSIHSVFDILVQTVSCVFVHKENYCAFDCLMTELATISVKISFIFVSSHFFAMEIASKCTPNRCWRLKRM